MAKQQQRRFFKFFLVVFAFLGGSLPQALGAGARASEMASSGQASAPAVKRDLLLNGLQVMTLEQPGSGGVTLRLRVHSGAVFDLLGKGGLADLTAGMLLKGGGTLTAKSLEELVEQLGWRLSVRVGWDATDIELRGGADDLELMFETLSQLVITPKFDDKELAALRSARLAAVKEAATRDDEILKRRALAAVYGSHPYGKTREGYAESLEKISRNDLTYFHNKFYLANNAALVVAGEVSAEQVKRLARTRLGAWKKGNRTEAMFRAAEPPASRAMLLIDKPTAATVKGVLAQIGFSRRAEDYLAAQVMTEILKANLSRQTAGKARLESEARLLAGPAFVHLEAPPTEVAPLIEKVIAEMTAMQKTGASAAEVEAAKARFAATFADERAENFAELLLDMELYGLGKDYLVRFDDRLQGIGPAAIQQAAQRYLQPQALTVVMLGAARTLETELKKLGSVTITP